MYQYRIVNRRTGQVEVVWNSYWPFVSVSHEEYGYRPYPTYRVLGVKVYGRVLAEDEGLEWSVRWDYLLTLIGLGLPSLAIVCSWLL